jgi:hypothetical protein
VQGLTVTLVPRKRESTGEGMGECNVQASKEGKVTLD